MIKLQNKHRDYGNHDHIYLTYIIMDQSTGKIKWMRSPPLPTPPFLLHSEHIRILS